MRALVSGVMSLLVTVSVASAAYIDFTDPSFQQVSGKGIDQISEYGMTLKAAPEDAILTWSDDGLGVSFKEGWWDRDEKDEIDWPERLSIVFDKTTYLNSVNLTNLHYGFFASESGGYLLSNGDSGDFHGINEDGTLTLDIGASVDEITLYADWGIGHWKEFSVAGVSVPEPATLSLLGTSLLTLFAMARFKRRKKN